MISEDMELYQSIYETYYDMATSRRGEFLTDIISLEMAFDEYIPNFFCGVKSANKYNYLSQVFKKSIGLKDKIDIVVWIIENEDHVIKKACPNFKSDLASILKLRNEFAHNNLVYDKMTKYLSNKQIALENYKNPKQPVIITETHFNNLISKMLEYETLISNVGLFSVNGSAKPAKKV